MYVTLNESSFFRHVMSNPMTREYGNDSIQGDVPCEVEFQADHI